VGTRPAPAPSSGLEQNIAGLLCWLPIGPVPILASAFFLLAEPYKSNRFIRFHATQAVLTVIALCAAWVGLIVVSTVLGMMPVLGLLMIPIWFAYGLGSLGLFIYMSIKAYGNESPKLPYIGELAEKYSGG
jgi:uncharacterized membrane protein